MIVEWQAAKTAARTALPAVLGAIAMFGPAFMLGQCSGVEIQKNRQAAASVPAVQRMGEANTSAATERANSNHNITAAQQEQSNAIQSAPDQKPSPGRVRRGCVQLRQQGTPADRLPPECRSEGGG